MPHPIDATLNSYLALALPARLLITLAMATVINVAPTRNSAPPPSTAALFIPTAAVIIIQITVAIRHAMSALLKFALIIHLRSTDGSVTATVRSPAALPIGEYQSELPIGHFDPDRRPQFTLLLIANPRRQSPPPARSEPLGTIVANS